MKSAQCMAARTLATHAHASPASKLVARTRPLPQRKQALYAQHEYLLSSNDVVLFLRPGDFSAGEWRQLRSAIAKVPAPQTDSSRAPSSSTSPAPDAPSKLKLTVLRPGLLPAILRDPTAAERFDSSLLQTHLAGPLAVLTSPSLHPPTLSKVLAILNKFSTTPSRNAPPPDPKQKTKQDAPERLELVSALFESRAATPDRTKLVSKLPELDILRAQIVGLLSMPGARITGVLGQRGLDLARTLQGFKAGLEAGSQQEAAAAAAPGEASETKAP